MKSKKTNVPTMNLWIPECRHLNGETRTIGFEILCMFLSAINTFTDIIHEDLIHAENMWNELMDALLLKYDPDSSCGLPHDGHKQTSIKPYSLSYDINTLARLDD